MDDEPDPVWLSEYAEFIKQQDEDLELTEAWELIEWNEQRQRQSPR